MTGRLVRVQSGKRATTKNSVASHARILLVEDDGARSKRQPITGLRQRSAAAITVRVHSIVDGEWKSIVGETHVTKRSKMAGIDGKSGEALKLLRSTYPRQNQSIVVAGASYGSRNNFVSSLAEEKFEFAVEIRPSESVDCTRGVGKRKAGKTTASDLLKAAEWRNAEIVPPGVATSVQYSLADLAEVRLAGGETGRLFAAQIGRIDGLHPGTIVGLTSVQNASLEDLVRCLGWARWIRPFVRRQERTSQKSPSLLGSNNAAKPGYGPTLRYRSNITLARLQDSSSEAADPESFKRGPSGVQFGGVKVVNLVELFAGAGGMGLGFLQAENRKRRFRLLFSGELHPIYVQTLRQSHDCLIRRRRIKRGESVPESVQSLNLSGRKVLDHLVSTARAAGGTDVLIGGPPCQGFSNANRNSWSSNNPQNRLVSVFMKYVEKLKPRVFLMENVQGIVWTAKNGRASVQPSVADHMLKRMKSAGYMVFPKLLDAVWYGVPQFRTRFFVVGIHRDSGYHTEDFGSWGPFPAPTHGPAAGCPFVTVRDAIADLPVIGNGHSLEEMDYAESVTDSGYGFRSLMRRGAPSNSILDHVTSRHADYVIQRYERIPPGGNWEDIAEMMSNYAKVERTHSNIYRRLEWDEPSITIGHYRKSMLVHPSQHRGLSLREACRLQSFPDWFRFAGTEDGRSGGLMHKQQQLANAVCPLLSRAIAEFILEL
jgi:DNA-cytosine methyltransferase